MPMPDHQVLPLTAYIFEYGPIRTLKSMSKHWSFNVLFKNIKINKDLS